MMPKGCPIIKYPNQNNRLFKLGFTIYTNDDDVGETYMLEFVLNNHDWDIKEHNGESDEVNLSDYTNH
jgi:hypothetical protein